MRAPSAPCGASATPPRRRERPRRAVRPPDPRISIVSRLVSPPLVAAIAVLVAGLVSYPLVSSAAETQARQQLPARRPTSRRRSTARTTASWADDERLPRLRQVAALQGADLGRRRPAQGCRLAARDGGGPRRHPCRRHGERRAPDGVRRHGARRGSPAGHRPVGVPGAAVRRRAGVEAGRRAAPARAGAADRPAHRRARRLLAARRVVRPLRRAPPTPPSEMSSGARDVALRPDGPVEVADIAASLNRLTSAARPVSRAASASSCSPSPTSCARR